MPSVGGVTSSKSDYFPLFVDCRLDQVEGNIEYLYC